MARKASSRLLAQLMPDFGGFEFYPGRCLLNECIRETLITREPISLPERHEMRVPIQLPGYFLSPATCGSR